MCKITNIFLILLIATIIGRVLRFRGGAERPSPTIENLIARINAWWAMVALIGFAFVFGKTGVIILSAVLSFAALREFVTLTYTRRGDHWALLATEKLLSLESDFDPHLSRELLIQHDIQISNAIIQHQIKDSRRPEYDGGFSADGRTTPTATQLEGLQAVRALLSSGHELQGQIRVGR